MARLSFALHPPACPSKRCLFPVCKTKCSAIYQSLNRKPSSNSSLHEWRRYLTFFKQDSVPRCAERIKWNVTVRVSLAVRNLGTAENSNIDPDSKQLLQLPPDAKSIFGEDKEVRADRFLCALNYLESRKSALGQTFLKSASLEVHPSRILEFLGGGKYLSNIASNMKRFASASQQPIRIMNMKDKIPLFMLLDCPVEDFNTELLDSCITLRGQPIGAKLIPLHLVIYKPKGYICSHDESFSLGESGNSRLVYTLLPEYAQGDSLCNRKDAKLSTVGRLDSMASGLLLLTQSGSVIHRITSPNHHVPKTYRIKIEQNLSKLEGEALCDKFVSGKVVLTERDQSQVTCRPCPIRRLDDQWYEVKLNQGMYHQLRRMFGSQGQRVEEIHRTCIGNGFSLEYFGLENPGDVRKIDLATMARICMTG